MLDNIELIRENVLDIQKQDDFDKLNWSMRFKRRHPRTWGFMAIVPLLFTTVIVCPICFLWDIVYEIPKDVDWKIHECDSNERIAEKHRTWVTD